MLHSLIEANKRKSIALVCMMSLLLVAGGGIIGLQWFQNPWTGIALGLCFAALYFAFSYYEGSSLLLATTGAVELHSPNDAPVLWNVVEEMKIASGLKNMPRIFVVDESTPNAFATGTNYENCAVTATTGLLRILNRDELQGVMAHEIAHIRNYDIRFMMLLSVMVGSIALLADFVFRSFFYTSMLGGRSSRSRSGGGQMGALITIAALAFAIVGPLLAQIIYFASSRKREYLADACGALYTRYPEGLASALEKISASSSQWQGFPKTSMGMLIVPLKLWSTHPPTESRIAILRQIGSSTYSLGQYQQAFREVTGQTTLFKKEDQETLKQGISPRAPTDGIRRAQGYRKGNEEKLHNVMDALRSRNGFLFMTCECGVGLKVPPNQRNRPFRCPKCKRTHRLGG